MGTSFLLDLGVVVLGALAGGWLASRMGLPLIVGYLVCGVVIGPHALGWISDPATIDRLATLGVALLMFSLGVEVTISELKGIWRTALGAALMQITATIALVSVGALALGVPPRAALTLGAVLSLSSTALVLRTLSERGEAESLHGRILLGILVLQDLAVLPMVLALPLLASQAPSAALTRSLGLSALFVALTLGLGTRLAPRLLRAAASLRQPELFFLCVVGMCFALAAVAERVGVGVALGAFLAGLVIAPAREGTQALADVRPLRDLFATVFFVSLGMLFDPSIALRHPAAILALLCVIVGLKGVLGAVSAAAFGASRAAALGVGLGLAQSGEFTFVLAGMANRLGLLPGDPFAQVLAASVFSLLLAPFLIASPPAVTHWLLARRGLRGLLGEPPRRVERLLNTELRRHVVIAGYGRMGRRLGEELTRWGVPCLVVERDMGHLEAHRRAGGMALYGDATRPEVLKQCHLKSARMLLIALPDSPSAELCLIEALKQAPGLEAVVRAHRTRDLEAFYALGAAAVIQPEFEASLEAIRRGLVGYGFDPREVGLYLQQVRARHYVALRGAEAIDRGALPPLGNVGLELAWRTIEKGSSALDRSPRELEHPYIRGVALLAIRHEGRTYPVPLGLERLHIGDEVLLLAEPTVLAAVSELVRGQASRLAEGNETG